MSEPAWEEMLEIRQLECNSRTLVNASKDGSKFSNESLKLFSDDLLQVRGDGSFNQASEDVSVEHLLLELEPKYNDSVLDFDAFNLKKCFSIEELSALEYGHVEANVDRLNSSLIQGEKTTHKLFDGKSEGINDDFCDGINNLPGIYEDFLLDAEFEECVSDFYSVPSKEYCMGNLNLDQHLNSGLGQCGSKIVELSTSSKLVSEAKCDTNSSLLDKMTTDELHVAFRKVLCRETIVMNREWLKNRILFGLQNLDALDNCLNLLECHVTSYDNKGAVSKINELPLRASNPFTEVFRFKTKPRSRHMRRQRHGKRDYLKTFSAEVSKSVSSLPDLGERESVIVAKGRMCRPAQSCMDGSVAKKLRSPRRNFEDSVAFSKDKVPRIRSKRQYYQEGFRATASVHEVGKNTFEGACTQPPFGLPLDKESSKEEGHEFEACTDVGSLGSCVDSDMELYSAESQDFSSQDESLTITKTRKSKGRRKQHILWSLPEVLKLVDGVSEFGVGRWTDIKRVLFPSSPHRSSVDLKDKWRNLLRASRKHSQHSASEAESRQKQHRSLYIPPKILHRVRELAVIFPYPREHKAKASKNVGITSKFCVQKCDHLLPLSVMTV